MQTKDTAVTASAQQILNQVRKAVVGKDTVLLWVLAAITVGGSLMGITGMLLGVPIAAALYRLLKEDVLRREGTKK